MQLGFGFWNKILATTLLYGALTTLVAVETDRATGALPLFDQFDNGGLLVIILASGSVGLQLLRKKLAEAGQWIPARRFALALTWSLAVESALAGSLPLVLICLMVLGMHVVLPKVLLE